jgi:hypothetical protein
MKDVVTNDNKSSMRMLDLQGLECGIDHDGSVDLGNCQTALSPGQYCLFFLDTSIQFLATAL